MKKKTALKKQHAPARKLRKKDDQYVVLVRSWVFLVAFALMLGMGVIVGNYVNAQLNASTPQVAGVSTAR